MEKMINTKLKLEPFKTYFLALLTLNQTLTLEFPLQWAKQ